MTTQQDLLRAADSLIQSSRGRAMADRAASVTQRAIRPLRRPIKPTKLLEGKPSLPEEVFDRVTWLAVRDALKQLARVPPGEFHGEDLGLAIFRDNIVAAGARDVRKLDKRFGSRSQVKDLEYAIQTDPTTAWLHWRALAAIRKARKRGEMLCRQLARLGYLLHVEPIDEGYWRPTDMASSLMEMKALKRISRAEGLRVLQRVLAAADRYNQEPEAPWLISGIYLFGSMLRSVDTVGDVDLVCEVGRRYAEEDGETFRRRDLARLEATTPSKLGSMMATSAFEGPSRLQRVSSYASVVSRMGMLEQLTEREEKYLLVYAHTSRIEAERAEAAANLGEVKRSIGTSTI